MKKLSSALILFSIVLAPSIARADLEVPTGIDSIPADGKYAPPCARGDIMVGDICVDRRFANVFQSDTSNRRLERIESRDDTHRTMQEETRSFYLHPTGVRAARFYNGFELLEPNSRQYQMSETMLQFNMRTLRARQAEVGPVTSRSDLSSGARATTRTKRDHFWDPTNERVRRGLRL